MKEKYYVVDFTAKTYGSIRIKAKNKRDAYLKACEMDAAFDQMEDQMDCTKLSDFDYEFDDKSVCVDEDQFSGPGQEDDDDTKDD